MDTPQERQRIVILGAGFGGLTAAVTLSKRLGRGSGIEIVLVDRATHHLYRPWLYEVATGEADEAHLKAGVATPYEDLRSHLASQGVQVEYEEVTGLDPAARAVRLGDGRALAYDALIVALGTVPDFYGIEGLEAHSLPMYTLREAIAINRRLRALIDMKRRNEIPFIRVLIGGAGPTGVEFACELARFMRAQVRGGRLAPGAYSIELVEASPRPLQALHPQLSKWAAQRLERLGIRLILDACIKGAHKDHVVLSPRPLKPGETQDMLICDFKKEREKEVTADLLVWCGGFRANPVVPSLGLTADARGRILVDDRLQAQGQPRVWAIGDCALLIDPKTKRPVPQLAQAAIAQAETAAENALHALRNRPAARYRFPALHAVVPMGGAWGVADVYGFRFRGRIVWPVRLAADIHYFLKTLPFRSAWKLIRAPLTAFRRNTL